MREYLTLHRSVFPSYLTIESGRIVYICTTLSDTGLVALELIYCVNCDL